VQGHPEQQGTIDFPVGRHPEQREKMYAFHHNYGTPRPMRSALTHYTVLEYFTDTALLELKPVTGRTHQLRVHCAAIGHPLIGDPVYGVKSKKIKRQALHAHCIAFNFMGTDHLFSAKYPDDFMELLAEERSVRIVGIEDQQ
jgi:23S rRNA pseudouridine1911/1915/1917 synthase